MPWFSYIATNDRDGKSVRGTVESDSVARAIETLSKKSLTVVSIEQIGGPHLVRPELVEDSKSFRESGSVVVSGGAMRVVDGSASLSSLLQHLIDRKERVILPLEALSKDLPKQPYRGRLQSLLRLLGSSGVTPQLLQTQFPDWIPTLVAMHRSRIVPSSLSTAVEQAAELSWQQSLRWRGVLYPLFISGLAFLVLVGALWLVVPEFAFLFGEFEIRLPAPTLSLLWLSDLLRFNPLAFFGGSLALFGAVILICAAIIHQWSIFRLVHYVIVRRPAKLSAASLIASQLADLLDAGVPAGEALRVIGKGCTYPSLRPAISSLASHVESLLSPDGVPLTQGITALEDVHDRSAATAIPKDIRRSLLSSPADTRLLRDLATLYRDRFDARRETESGWYSPVAMVLVGLVIGWLVLALLVPIVSLIDGLA